MGFQQKLSWAWSVGSDTYGSKKRGQKNGEQNVALPCQEICKGIPWWRCASRHLQAIQLIPWSIEAPFRGTPLGIPWEGLVYYDHCSTWGRQLGQFRPHSVLDKHRPGRQHISAEGIGSPLGSEMPMWNCEHYSIVFGLSWILINDLYGEISPPRECLAAPKATF